MAKRLKACLANGTIMKRNYKSVNVVCVNRSYSIALDDCILKTPQKVPYSLPTRELAEAMASEWRVQVDEIDFKSMPLSMIANVASDHVQLRREEVISTIIRYAMTDLLCYRTKNPAELAELQEESWQPLLDWVSSNLGIALKTTVGILPVEQNCDAINALRVKLVEYDHFRLAALHILTGALGSIVLALAVTEFHIDVTQAFKLSQLDETYQVSRWGEDSEAREGSETTRKSAVFAAQFLTLLQGWQSNSDVVTL